MSACLSVYESFVLNTCVCVWMCLFDCCHVGLWIDHNGTVWHRVMAMFGKTTKSLGLLLNDVQNNRNVATKISKSLLQCHFECCIPRIMFRFKFGHNFISYLSCNAQLYVKNMTIHYVVYVMSWTFSGIHHV